MTTFSPKEIFNRLHKADSAELQAHREDAWLVNGLAFSLSEMAHAGADSSELKGARRLIKTLRNLWEEKAEPMKFPVVSLDADKPDKELNER